MTSNYTQLESRSRRGRTQWSALGQAGGVKLFCLVDLACTFTFYSSGGFSVSPQALRARDHLSGAGVRVNAWGGRERRRRGRGWLKCCFSPQKP